MLTKGKIEEIIEKRVLVRAIDLTVSDGALGREVVHRWAWLLAIVGGELIEIRHFLPRTPESSPDGLLISRFREREVDSRVTALLSYWEKHMDDLWLGEEQAIYSFQLKGITKSTASALELIGKVNFLSGLLYANAPEPNYDEGGESLPSYNPFVTVRKRLDGLALDIGSGTRKEMWDTARKIAGEPK